jgi:hypothetical protein
MRKSRFYGSRDDRRSWCYCAIVSVSDYHGHPRNAIAQGRQDRRSSPEPYRDIPLWCPGNRLRYTGKLELRLPRCQLFDTLRTVLYHR